MNVTLDTNCIIALEKNEAEASFVRELLSLHDSHTINVRVVAISASERKQDGTYAVGFHEFTHKLAAVGLGQVEILPTLAYPGMAFPNWCYPTGGEPTSLERNIHEILFPTTVFENRDYRTRVLNDPTSDTGDPQWRNKKCDVLVLWSHIHFHGNIFVTSDNNFRSVSKKGQLIALGAGAILTPQEAVKTIRANI